MRFDPCGRAVDFGRRPYTTKCRPFRGSEEEVDLVWYPCAPGAETFPFPSIMAMGEWDADMQEWLPGGEVPDAPKVYNGEKPKPGTGRGHFCGTEQDFAEGCVRDETIPPVGRGVLGLPDCCRAAVVGNAGVRDGGRAMVVWPLTPGTSCEAATPWPVGAGLQPVTTPPAGVDYWWRWPVVNGTTYRVRRVLDDPFSVIGLQVGEGVACPPTVIHTFTFDPPDWSVDLTASVSGFMWLHMISAAPNEWGAQVSVEEL